MVWKLPMGTPNWWRSLAYCTPMSSACTGQAGLPGRGECPPEVEGNVGGGGVADDLGTDRGDDGGGAAAELGDGSSIGVRGGAEVDADELAVEPPDDGIGDRRVGDGPAPLERAGMEHDEPVTGVAGEPRRHQRLDHRARREVGAGALGHDREVDGGGPALGVADRRDAELAERRPQLGVEPPPSTSRTRSGSESLASSRSSDSASASCSGERPRFTRRRHVLLGSGTGGLQKTAIRRDGADEADERDEQAAAAVEVVGEVEGVVEAPLARTGDGDEDRQHGEHEVVLPAVLEDEEVALVGPGGHEHESRRTRPR